MLENIWEIYIDTLMIIMMLIFRDYCLETNRDLKMVKFLDMMKSSN